MAYDVRPIGVVESTLTDPASAPKQGVEGGLEAWLVLDPAWRTASLTLRSATTSSS